MNSKLYIRLIKMGISTSKLNFYTIKLMLSTEQIIKVEAYIGLYKHIAAIVNGYCVNILLFNIGENYW